MMKWLALSALICSSALLASPVQFHSSSSSFLKNEVLNALELLPASFLGAAQGKVFFDVKKLKSDRAITADLCQMGDEARFAQTKRKGKKHFITISAAFLEEAERNEKEFSCSHGTFKKMLKAAILHELTHVKDNFEKISKDPDFQRIVGVKKLQSSKRRIMNQNHETSPDAYEFKNLEEALAVNTEYLLLDPEFECRRPATASFLSKMLNIPLKGQCQKSYKIVTQSAFLEDNYQQAVSIDPKRIYQVHYLFAGKGQALMSRWGHAMFRLIVCAPFREKAGPDCLKDVSHHLALSYRAYMNDMSINYAKGMFGAYPSQLFVFRFHEVQQEYTKFELRDLHSLPLKLSDEQKENFIDLTLERFWTYQGKYYFIDNNCGTETRKHLAVALDEDVSRLIRSVTPLRIYKDIIRNEAQLSADENQLIPSLFGELDSTYQTLKDVGIFQERDFKKFLKKTTSSERLKEYERFFSTASLDSGLESSLVMKVIYLERYLTTQFMLALPKKAFQKINKDEGIKKEVMEMSESLKTLFTQPWDVVNSVYGIPTQEEFERDFKKFQAKRKAELKLSTEVQMDKLQSILGKEYFTAELREIEEMKKIKTFTNSLFNQISGVN